MVRLLHESLGLSPGNWSIEDVTIEAWGSQVLIDCVHRFPPDEKPFRLVFEDVRSIQWFVQKRGDELQKLTSAQLMSHDLGVGNYERTARFATPLAEIIISYERLKIERLWKD